MSPERSLKSDDKLPAILMADDDDDDRLLARDAFRESKVRGTFICVEDGIDLLDYLHNCGKNARDLPALILLDLNMPRKNGRQALAEIRSIPAFQHIPIVVLTTSRQKSDIEFLHEMGAIDFITKPVLFSEWVELMISLAGKWLAKHN